jgi:molybdenum cofactor synthesis domain-containing protein
MITLAEARETVLAGCPVPSGTATVRLADGLGCVLASAVLSDEAVPPFANTAMDGFAVQAADTANAPVRLQIVGTLAAGEAPSAKVGAGQAIRIMTGAPVPEGADAIVPVEVTEADGDEVEIKEAARPGAHVRPAGEDIAVGQEVFPAGTVLGPGHRGVLASIGVDQVEVLPRVRVGVLSTGDELVEGGGELAPGQIRDSNRHTLLALCRQSGFEAVDLGIAADDELVIEAAVKRGIETCDAIVTSGGVSMGDFDYVKVVLDRLSGGGMRWMQVAIKPAKPLAFGTVNGTPVFGLPGNPVSSMVSFELFARPGLRRMMGFRQLDRPRALGVADEPLRRGTDGKIHFVRVAAEIGADGRFHVRSSGGQASNLLRAMALANALAVVPDGPGVEAGGDVEIMLLGG